MKKFPWVMIAIGMSLPMLVGCAERNSSATPAMDLMSETFVLPQRIEDLAGPWEYQDTEGEGTMRLNAMGNGKYDWADGRFETLSLENGIWTGVWIQEGNDREGGFKLTFSDDSPSAQGSWWYTRIGKDKNPLQPGGMFNMARPSFLPESAQ